MLDSRSVVIVGAGRLAARVVAELPPSWAITLVDLDLQQMKAVAQRRPEGAPPPVMVQGDATSRLTLERACVGPSTALAVLTGDDAVNREVARMGRVYFMVEELAVLLDDAEGADAAGLQASEVVQSHVATAALVLNRLCGTETRSVALGLGMGELRQVTVLEGSAAVGRGLAEMRPQQWLVAAVYRDDALIVPHGETVLRAGDRVLLVGQPDVIEGVGSFIRGGRPVFPSQYGRGVATFGHVGPEARWLLDHTCAEGEPEVVDPAAVPASDPSRIKPVLDGLNAGILVVEPRPISWMARVGFSKSSRQALVHAAKRPVLVARGTFPFKRVLLAIGEHQNAEVVAGVAIDLARQCGGTLTVLTVTPPSFAEGEAEQEARRALPNRVAHIARLHGVVVDRRLDQGNPIERIRAHAKDFDLLVIGDSERSDNSLFKPDVSLFLMHDTPCSALFVPWNPAGR